MSESEQPASAGTPARPAEGGRTHPGDEPTRETLGNVSAVDFAFLDPPQGPDEIGTLGGYRVLRVLGKGGMGVVFEAEDTLLGRRVALKVPRGGIEDERFRQRFLREARIAATLPHDHIAAVYQAGHHNGVPFLAMELLRGESLEARLARDKSLPVAEALRLAREIATGLQAAHARGLVHRDVKPDNVWLEGEPGASATGVRVKILDFGVAREVRPQQGGLTRTGQIVGSLGYLAPEQVTGGAPDARTDLFALGCILHRMLLGELPFTAPDTVAAMRAVLTRDPTRFGEAGSYLPLAAAQLAGDLLQKDPDRRPASAALVAERLLQIERDLARPASAEQGAPVGLPAPKKRLSWGVLFGAAVLVAAALAGAFALVRKLNEPVAGPPGERPAQTQPAQGTPAAGGEPIKVGVLHSMTGPLASTEAGVAEATLLAIDEVNQPGGVLGRRVEGVLEDGRSTEEGFEAGPRSC